MNNFSYYIKKFFSQYLPVIRNFSPNTISSYQYAFLDFLSFLKEKKIKIDTLEINEFSYELVTEFITYLKSKNNKETTINVKISAIKSFITFISNENLSDLDECLKIKNIRPLRCKQEFPKYYTPEEIEFLLNSISLERKNGLKKLCIFTLLYDGALRVTEFCNLKVNDVKIISKNTSSIYIENSKNGLPRTILLGKKSTEILQAYLRKYTLSGDEPLFQNTFKNKYSRSGIYKMLQKAVEQAKNKCEDKNYFEIKPFPHILRHSKATHMLDIGVDLVTIRDFLGHMQLSSTETYAHVSKKKQEEILNKNILNKNIKKPRSKKEKMDLEHWLRNIL